MKAITKQEFETMVIQDARVVHNKYLRMGTFWPMETCKKEVRKKLKGMFSIKTK